MRKICVFTGTRAEYGLLKNLLKEIKSEDIIKLQIVASGMHLSPEFGLTYKEIEHDGHIIDEKVEMLVSSDTPIGVTKSIGLAMIGFSECLERLKPDIIVILGDRFETLAFAIAATIARIPIAHISGGETTEGAIDEPFRHSISKMSHLHFTSTENYRKRLIQLGEHPSRVFNTGALGIDNIKNLRLLLKKELEQELNFEFGIRNLLVTFHPVTLENNTSEEQFRNLLEALEQVQDLKIIFTKANADTNGRIINKMIDDYVSSHSIGAKSFTSMGQLRYLSTLQFVDAVVGNSSSGIIETPSFRKGTINIGERQKGRIKAESVIDCAPLKDSILEAITRLYSPEFLQLLENVINPYEGVDTARKIKNIIKSRELNGILKKSFYDIDMTNQ